MSEMANIAQLQSRAGGIDSGGERELLLFLASRRRRRRRDLFLSFKCVRQEGPAAGWSSGRPADRPTATKPATACASSGAQKACCSIERMNRSERERGAPAARIQTLPINKRAGRVLCATSRCVRSGRVAAARFGQWKFIGNPSVSSSSWRRPNFRRTRQLRRQLRFRFGRTTRPTN
jgi:hypothetical protein